MSVRNLSSLLSSREFPTASIEALKRRATVVVSSWVKTVSIVVLPDPRTPAIPKSGLATVKLAGKVEWHTGQTRMDVGPLQRGHSQLPFKVIRLRSGVKAG
jgi:hypothetical protein